MRVCRLSFVLGLIAIFAIAGAQAQDKSSSGCWPWPDSLDGVIASPQNHTVIYEDNNIRVLDVHTPSGTMNNLHDHQWSSVFLYYEAQPNGRDHKYDGKVTAVGGAVPADAPFPLLYVSGPQAPHAYENMDTFLKHFYRVEFKKIPFKCPTEIRRATAPKDLTDSLPQTNSASWPWPASMDSVAASPANHKVLLENENIRLVEVSIQPGEKENMSGCPWTSALLFYEPQPKGRDTSNDGKVTEVGRRLDGADFPVAVRVGPEPPHAFENIDIFPAHFYRVEFKKVKFRS
jgi:hypothetical protein